MDVSKVGGLLLFSFILLVFFNALITREIYNWVPSIKKQIGLYLLVWFLPVVGLLLANKLGNIGWFKKRSNSGSDSAVAGGRMEADSVLNPGAKHRIEMIEKQKSEIHHEHKQAGDKPNHT